MLENESASDEFSRDMVTVHVVEEPVTGRSDVEGAVKERLKSLTEVSPDRVVFEDDEAAFERLWGRLARSVSLSSPHSS